MKALILETSTEKSCLILAEDGAPLKSRFLAGGPELSKRLAAEAHVLLEGNPVDFLLVGQGPGSFTGIRVGAALAKGLSFGWSVPLYGFCSLKAFTPPADGSFAILVDARIGGFYTLLGNRTGSDIQWNTPQLLDPSQAHTFLDSIPTLTSPHPAQIQQRLPQRPCLESSIDPALLAKWAFSPRFKDPLALSYLDLKS